MRQAVIDNWFQANAPIEGVCDWMYLDVLGIVTTAVGNALFSVDAAVRLDWRLLDGRVADPNAVIAEYAAIKALQQFKDKGGGYFRNLSKLRLTEHSLNKLVSGKLLQNETHLKGRFGEWDSWPASAQMAISSVAWACGAGFQFPALAAYIKNQNWTKAKEEVHINEAGNPGVKPRNVMNKLLMAEAAEVKARGLAYDVLWYPERVPLEKLASTYVYPVKEDVVDKK